MKLLLRVDKDIREGIVDKGWDLEGMLEDFGCDGVECEVRDCPNESAEFIELGSGDEVGNGRNVCETHANIINGWTRVFAPELALRAEWDDGTHTIFKGEGEGGGEDTDQEDTD